MTISTTISDRGTLISGVAFTTTAAIISERILYANHWARRLVYHVVPTVAGTLMVQHQMSDGNWYDVLAAAVACPANTLTTLDFGIPCRKTRVVFTPGAAPGTVLIDAESVPFGP